MPHTPKPVALFLRFGKNATYGGKKIPATLVKAPAWIYRTEFNEICKAVDALPDPPVPEKDTEAMFAVMEGFLDEMDLFGELCSDEEMTDDDFEITPSNAFRLNGSAKEIRAALEKDGFRVVTVIDPLATPKIEQTDEEILESNFEGIEHDLDLASMTVARACLAKDEDLPRHAGNVIQQVFAVLSRNAKWLPKRLGKAMGSWSDEQQKLFRFLIEHAAKDPERKKMMTALLEAIPKSEL